jgi:hypothetical protein
MSTSPPPRRRRSSCSFDGFAQTRQQWQQRVSAIEEQKVVESRRRSSLSHLDFGKPVNLELPNPLRSEAVTLPPTPRKLSAASKEPFESVPYSAPADLNMHGLTRVARAADQQRLRTPGELSTPEQQGDDDETGALLSEQELVDSQQPVMSQQQPQQQQQQQQQPSAAQPSVTDVAIDEQAQDDLNLQPELDQQHIAGAGNTTDTFLQSTEPSALAHQQLATEAEQVVQDSSGEQQQTTTTETAAAAAAAAVVELAEALQVREQQQAAATVDAAETAAVDTTAATVDAIVTKGIEAADSDDELFFDAVTAESPQQLSEAACTTTATVATIAPAASSTQHSVTATTATAIAQTVAQTVGQTVGQQRVTFPSPFFNFTLTEGGSQIVAECGRLRAQVRAADARSAALQARLTAKEYVLQAVLQRSEEQQRMHAEQCW